jgi:protein-tyrosine phosphatase
MLDLHCHLLPGIDDGPALQADAIAMAEAHVAAGVDTVVCTPHVDWSVDNTAADIASAVTRLRSAIDGAGIPLRIAPGAEVGLTRALELPDAELVRLCIAGGPWLLLEAPLRPSTGVEMAIGQILMRGHRVLLAHPERSPAFQGDVDALRRLVASGVLCQVTASSLTGAFGSRVRRFATELVREGLTHVVASDAHDVTRRPPGLRSHIEAAGLGEHVDHLTETVPTAILSGGQIPGYRPRIVVASRRRWFQRG